MLERKIIGDITVTVCELDGHNFFYLHADNNNVLPVLDNIKDFLNKH